MACGFCRMVRKLLLWVPREQVLCRATQAVAFVPQISAESLSEDCPGLKRVMITPPPGSLPLMAGWWDRRLQRPGSLPLFETTQKDQPSSSTPLQIPESSVADVLKAFSSSLQTSLTSNHPYFPNNLPTCRFPFQNLLNGVLDLRHLLQMVKIKTRDRQ